MEILESTLLGNPVRSWLVAAGVTLLVAALLRLFVRVLLARVQDLASRTSIPYDDALVRALRRTGWLFILAVAIRIGLEGISLPPVVESWIDRLVLFAVLLQVGLWASSWMGDVLDAWRRRRFADDPEALSSYNLLRYAALVLVWSAVLLLFLDNVGIDVTALIAGLGVGGIAIALALQSLLGDLFASLSIVLDKPFLVGDFLIVDDKLGTVESIGLKTTRLRSLSGEQLVFANADLLDSRIRNYGRMQERRAVFRFGVVYGTDPAKLRAIPGIVRESIEALENTRFDRSHFKSFGDSSLEFETVYYMTVPDYNSYMDVQQAINLTLFERFAAEGIEFAFPTRTVYSHAVASGPARNADSDPAAGRRSVDDPGESV
jgi:small-conductance mechanosensitive channel